MKGYTLVSNESLEYLFLNLADWKNDRVKVYKSDTDYQLWVPNEIINWECYRQHELFEMVGAKSYTYEDLEVRSLNGLFFIVHNSCPEIVNVVESKSCVNFQTVNGFMDSNPPWIYGFSTKDVDDAWSTLKR